MIKYKRNQIEEALSRFMGETSATPSTELRTRLKRLLDTDRTFEPDPRSDDPEPDDYAFYEHEPVGKGADTKFSEYEAFALLTGLRILQHRWPQRFAVSLLRRMRTSLERQHARILKQSYNELFDAKAIEINAKSGTLAFDNTDPVFLVIVSSRGHHGNNQSPVYAVCRGMKQLSDYLRKSEAWSYSLLELVTPAHGLAKHLSKTTARKRGRGN